MRAAIEGGYIKPLLDRVHPHPDDALFHLPPRSFADMADVGASAAEAASLVASIDDKAQWFLVAPAGQAPPLDDLPGLYPFSQAVIMMPNTTPTTIWADPLCDVCSANQVGFDVAGGRAMRMTQPVKWVDVPLSLALRDTRRYTVDWELSVRGDLTGTVLAEMHGPAAGRARGLLGDTEDAAVRATAARRVLFEDVGPQVEALNDEGTAGNDSQYTLQANISSHLPTEGGVVSVRALDVAGDAFPWELPAGNHEIMLEAPQGFETSCSIAMPLPIARSNRFKPVSIKTSFGTYESRFETRSNFLLYVRRLDLQVRLVTPDKRADLAAFISKIREAERKPTVVHLED